MLTEDVGWEALKMSYCIASETYWNLDAIEWWLISTHTTRFMIFLFSPAGRQGLGCFELREEWLTSPWENKTEQRPWFVPVAGGSFFSRQLRYVHVTPIVHIMNFEIYIYIYWSSNSESVACETILHITLEYAQICTDYIVNTEPADWLKNIV